jgi:hypothetical protein
VLRELSSEEVRASGLLASFIIDDPNLRWASYGYFDFRQAAAYLERRHLHMSIASVPMDWWGARRRVIDLVGRSPSLSVSVHGNRHLKREMGRAVDPADANRFYSQARRRMARLERRGLDVDQVIIPPHGEISQDMHANLAGQGFDAVCYTGPMGVAAHDLMEVNLYPADIHLRGHVPGLHRIKFNVSESQLRTRAFLGHPLIIYGHHGDFANGLGVLVNTAALVRTCGDARWSSLQRIGLSNFSYVRRGDAVEIRSWSTRIGFAAPEGVEQAIVRWPSGETSLEAIAPGRVNVLMDVSVPGVEDASTGFDRLLPRAILRRMATEMRDRSMPAVAKLRTAGRAQARSSDLI